MQDYTQYCTAEQTHKAYDLNAPLVYYPMHDNSIATFDCIEIVNEFGKQFKAAIPTTQQMINWLRNQDYIFRIDDGYENTCVTVFKKDENVIFIKALTKDKAELAAIDAALNHLEQKKL